MELEAENVKNIRSLALCKELLRQAIEQNDKLIAEKENDIASLEKKLDEERQFGINRAKSADHTIGLMTVEFKQKLYHQKYNRCRAMARWCFTKSNYHFVVGRSEGGKNELTHYRISRLYSKWHKRWLKLAEQFKETKRWVM